jgi:hypothetical protein
MTLKGATERFPPRRLPDGSTISIRAINDKLYLFLTLADGREASRRITEDVAEAYWDRGRHFVAAMLLEEMQSELGVK